MPGALGKVIVDITHSLVVERSYYNNLLYNKLYVAVSFAAN